MSDGLVPAKIDEVALLKRLEFLYADIKARLGVETAEKMYGDKIRILKKRRANA